MKKAKLFLAFCILLLFIINGCSNRCETKLYAKNGKCCNYICEKDCPNGYAGGTCKCECISSIEESSLDDSKDTNIGDIFGEEVDVKPPELPTP